MRANRRRCFITIVGTLLVVLAVRSASAAGSTRILYFEPLQPDEESRVQAQGLPASADARRLNFTAFGQDFRLRLQPNAHLTEGRAPRGYSVEAGQLQDIPGSWVRLTRRGLALTGLIWDGREFYAIEPAPQVLPFVSKSAAAPGTTNVIYRLRDLRLPPEGLACGLGAGKQAVTGTEAISALLEELKAPEKIAAMGATLRVSLAAIGDFEFYQEHGADSESEIMARFNTVDGIFTGQLGIEVAVDDVTVFQSSDDPFTSSDGSILLDEVANFRGQGQTQFGITHLLTGRQLLNSVVGYAFQGGVCLAREGAALSSDAGTTALAHALIAAHETGHNFGSPHDGESGSPCASTPTTFLMAAHVTGSSRFSECSRRQMAPVIARASCLARLADYDVALLPSAAATAPAGQTVEMTFGATNMGNRASSAVSLRVRPPAGIAVVSVSGAPGVCDSGPAVVACDLSILNTGGEWHTTIGLRSDSPGTYAVQADLTAADDSNATNNSAAVPLTIEPLVGLSATFPASQSLAVGASTTQILRITNHGRHVAQDVTVSFSTSPGVSIMALSGNAGSCSTTGTPQCSLGTLAVNADADVRVTVKGTIAGAQHVTATVQAAQADLITSNSTASLAIDVQQGASPGGGGGAVDALSLLLFLALLWATNSAAPRRRLLRLRPLNIPDRPV